MVEIKINKHVSRPFAAFKNRREAGEELIKFMDEESREQSSIVLAVPRGGVPVGEPVAEWLQCPLEPVFARKLPVPASPEMGFGAVTIDGSRVLNEEFLKDYYISEEQIDSIAADVQKEVKRRAKEYAGTDQPPNVKGKNVYLVDDGLATGFSMIAAAKMVNNYEPKSTILCVPVSPLDSIERVKNNFNEIYCLYAQDHPPFAVASYYQDFHDMADEEVKQMLKSVQENV